MSPPNLFWQRLLILLAAVLGVAVTFSLGMWQLGRGAEKLALHAIQHDRSAMTALDGRMLTPHMDHVALTGVWHRKMVLKGQWLPEHTVYLDNRQMQGRSGFFVMTPMKLAETGVVVLVQRGWAPRSFTDRLALPQVETPNQSIEISGRLAPWPSRLYDFGGMESGVMRQNLDLTLFRQQTGLPLQDLSVIQEGAASEGLLRDWPAVASGVEKHHGYAFQWFGLSALIALLYVWFQIVQVRRKQRTA